MEDGKPWRRRLRVERNEPGALNVPDPVLAPLDVGSIGGQGLGGANREPIAMTATIDIDTLPRLREAFERHAAGNALDVVSQWHTAVSDEVALPPLALLRLQFPEFGLVFNVGFDVEEHKRSLTIVARTGVVMLWEPSMSAAIRLDPMEQAFREHLTIGVTVTARAVTASPFTAVRHSVRRTNRALHGRAAR